MKISPIHPAVLTVGLFLVAVGAGWIIGATRSLEEPEMAETAPLPTRSGRRIDRASDQVSTSSIDRRMAPLRAARNADERRRAMIHLARTLPVSEIAGWYEGKWIYSGNIFEAQLFDRITRRRWLLEDPDGLLAWSLLRDDRDVAMSALNEWIHLDAQQAIEWMTGLDDPKLILRYSGSFGHNLARADPRLALEQVASMAARLPAKHHQVLHGMIMAIAGEHRDELRERARSWPDDLRTEANRCVTIVGLRTDFASELTQLAEDPDGLILMRHALSSAGMGREIYEHLDELPDGWLPSLAGNAQALVYHNPADWLSLDLAARGLADAQISEIRDCAWSKLLRQDPETAFAMLDGDLPAKDRMSILENGLSELARENPDRARFVVANLSDPEEIRIAGKIMESVREQLERKPPPQSPVEWVQRLGEPGGEDLRPGFGFSSGWNRQSIDDAARTFATLPAEQKARTADKLIEHFVHRDLPSPLCAEALSFLLRQHDPAQSGHPPPDSLDKRMTAGASILASSWVVNDPVAACRWVESLPAGEARSWAMKNLAARWTVYEPTEAANWARTLPADQQAQLKKVLETGRVNREE